jgi:hypothetical protein
MSPILYWTLLLATCLFAFRGGRRDERIAAGVALTASVLTLIAHSITTVDYAVVEGSDMLIDIAVLASFVVIAVQSQRFWPLWAAGLQMTSTLAHLMKAVDPTLIPHAYAAAARLWSYPILLIIIVGTWRGYQGRRRPPAARESG